MNTLRLTKSEEAVIMLNEAMESLDMAVRCFRENPTTATKEHAEKLFQKVMELAQKE